MARAVKKVKKEKTSTGKRKFPFKIIIPVATALLAGIIVTIVLLFSSDAFSTRLYSNSRDMDYQTLVEMYNDSDEREKYEGTIYVFIFNSEDDDETKENWDSMSFQSLNTRIKRSITADLKLNEKYNAETIEQSKRVAFYALDLAIDNNSSILADSNLGTDVDGPYILKLGSYGSNPTKTTTNIGSKLKEIYDSFEKLL